MGRLSTDTRQRRNHGKETALVELLDPFGAVIASGYLTPADIPGIDEGTPSAADQFAQRFRNKRTVLAGDGPEWSIRVS